MSEWDPIKTAPPNETVLVCNPSEGRVPVIAKRIGDDWHNIGAFPVGVRREFRNFILDPAPTHWMRWPDMPRL